MSETIKGESPQISDPCEYHETIGVFDWCNYDYEESTGRCDESCPNYVPKILEDRVI